MWAGAATSSDAFPAGWAEWNDRYRDTVRSLLRRDGGKIGELAERFAGSSDIFRHNGRKPTASINFPTAHDGFTLCDLVSYNDRHNEANLEGNTDGHSDNLSWNCGVEGPTDDAGVNELRKRQMRNIMATLFFSQGVPMLQAGTNSRAPSAATTTPIVRTTKYPGSIGACAAPTRICCGSCNCSRNCGGGTPNSAARPSSRVPRRAPVSRM